MTIRRSILAVTLLAAAQPAHADVTRRHGGLCAPKHASRDLVGVDERGIYNASTSAPATVTCPVVDRVSHNIKYFRPSESYEKNFVPRIESVRVWGRDLSATTPFSCYVFWTSDDNFSSWGPTKYMCSDSGGCNDSTSQFVGSASISWTLSTGIDEGAVEATDHVGVVCNVPPTTSSGSSYVKSLNTNDATISIVVSDPDKHTFETIWAW